MLTSGVVLHLNCVRRTEGRGRNNSARERLLWQDERRAPRESLHPGYRGITVPVDFAMPFECAPTDEDEANSGTQIIWRLHADAEVAGVDYSPQFEIPVFKTAIESGNVRIRSTLLGIGGAREIPCSEITGVKLGSSMRQQPTMTQAGPVYYAIELHRKVGKKVRRRQTHPQQARGPNGSSGK